ncbi:MAG: hypothetical protein HY868_15265 [Chloroflexi bacterium]|nr:hypothetical protein [Chloroflexota bacterium]
MKVAIANNTYPPARELLARGVSYRLRVLGYRNVEVLAYRYMEDLLDSTLDYDVFVCYSNFGKKMGGVEGAGLLRAYKPDARIIGVTTMHPKASRFRDLGAVGIIFPGEDEVKQICNVILAKAPPPATQCPKSRPRPLHFVEGRKLANEYVWLYACPDCRLKCLISVSDRAREFQGRPISPDEVDALRQNDELVLKANDVLANEIEIKWLP